MAIVDRNPMKTTKMIVDERNREFEHNSEAGTNYYFDNLTHHCPEKENEAADQNFCGRGPTLTLMIVHD